VLNESLERSRKELIQASEAIQDLRRLLERKDQDIEDLQEALASAESVIENRPEISDLDSKCRVFAKKLEKSNSHIELLRNRLEEEKVHNELLLSEHSCMVTKVAELERVQEALEQDILSLLSHGSLCGCPEKRRNEKGLCGRAILYVGGRSNLVHHYRQLVELLGGKFLYHDGGQQDSPRRLPELLLQADAVCCPLDCVSHDATMRIKRECKHTQTEQHLLRSSGVTSFARALADLSDIDNVAGATAAYPQPELLDEQGGST
jgi:hypothetical protein